MGTNYYWQETCTECEQPVGDKLHVGRYSPHWGFILHYHANNGIRRLEDWLKTFQKGGIITDEYHNVIAIKDIISLIRDNYEGIEEDFV